MKTEIITVGILTSEQLDKLETMVNYFKSQNFLAEMHSQICEDQEKVTLEDCTTYTAIKIRNLNDLTIARTLAKSVYPDWKDSYTITWESLGRMLGSWKDLNHPDIHIWLETSIEDFPIAKISPGCKIVKETKTDYNVVCERENEDA